jgi:hypothetical protein
MSDRLDPWMAALIRQERARRGPPPAIKAQVLESIRASLQSPAVLPQQAPMAGGSKVIPRTTLVYVSSLALALIGAGAWLASRMSSTPRDTPVVLVPSAAPSAAKSGREQGPSVVVATAHAPAAVPPVAATPPSASAATETARTATAHGSATSATPHLYAEQQLLDRARSLLLEGEPAAALKAIDIHRRRFPHGVLSEERDALQIEALGNAGRTDEACRALQAFHAAYPGSLLARAVEDVCGGAR